MSEAGWKAFVTAEGVADWVVLHGGPTAAFRTASLQEAAQLAAAIAEVPGLEDARSVLTVADQNVSVRLTRDLWGVEPGHIEVAQTVSTIARKHGATADRALVQEVQLAIAARLKGLTRRSGGRSSVTGPSPTTPRPTRSGTARRCGCKSSIRPSPCGTRCTSTCPSRASTWPLGSTPQSLPVAPWWTSPGSTGPCPIVRATACASPPGPTGIPTRRIHRHNPMREPSHVVPARPAP